MEAFANATTIIPEASVVTTAVVIFLSLLCLLSVRLVAEPTKCHVDDDSHHNDVPFIVIGEPSWSDLIDAVDQYNKDISRLLNGLSKSLEITIMSEWELWGKEHSSSSLQNRLQQQITNLSLVLEQDADVLESVLLQPFATVNVIADQPHYENHEQCSISSDDCHENFSFLPRFTRTPPVNDAASSYDSAAQVVAHMVRDWTVLGRGIRQSTYEWCRTQLELYLKDTTHSILVPGAGLGRLAYNLQQSGFHVEANDSSLIMAAAAHAVLSSNARGILHPFAMDYFVNEVDSEQRYEAVSFPDFHDCNNDSNRRGTLSYTVGDFVELYSAPYARGVYGAVVTCFFIDTATNIYEYLVPITNLLKEGRMWINVGPVQWHQNALVRPSVSELRLLIQGMGFTILSWSVDDKPVSYRHDEQTGEPVRSTKYEAYRPLRFVAVRSKKMPKTAPSSAIINNMRTRGQSTATATRFGANQKPPNTAQHISVSRPSSTVVIEELVEEVS